MPIYKWGWGGRGRVEPPTGPCPISLMSGWGLSWLPRQRWWHRQCSCVKRSALPGSWRVFPAGIPIPLSSTMGPSLIVSYDSSKTWSFMCVCVCVCLCVRVCVCTHSFNVSCILPGLRELGIHQKFAGSYRCLRLAILCWLNGCLNVDLLGVFIFLVMFLNGHSC